MALLYDVAFNSQTRALSFSDRAGNNIYSCDIPSKPLTLTALADNSSVKLTKSGTLNNTFEVNTGNGWSAYTFGDVINLNEGDQCQWRCSAHPDAQTRSAYVYFRMTGSIAASGNCNSMLDGTNFRTMTSIADYPCAFIFLFPRCASLVRPPALPATTLAPYCYCNMFYESGIIETPELPATTLTDHCYAEMFRNISTLVRACSLPALTLETSSYELMFKGSGITTPPEMSATSCASGTTRHCFRMFQECPNLTKSPDLKILDLFKQTYQQMFVGSPLVSEVHSAARSAIPGVDGSLYSWLDNGATNGDIYCDPTMNYPEGKSGIPNTWNRWVYGATDTGDTTTMYHNGTAETVRVGTSTYGTCYALQGWAGFKALAEMHALGYTLGEQTAVTMYHYVEQMAAYYCAANVSDGFAESMYDVGDGKGYLDIATQNIHGYYLSADECPLTLKATESSTITLKQVGTSANTYERNLGSKWVAYTLGTSISLSAGKTVQFRCSSHPDSQSSSNYVQFEMTGAFEALGNCNSMLDGTNFSTMTSLADYPYALYCLFRGCASLTRAPALPATTLADSCYFGLLRETSITSAPELPATTLTPYCYHTLFYKCGSLTVAPNLPATVLTQKAYYWMFDHCTALKEVRIAATDISATDCLTSWLNDVALSGDFYCDPHTTYPTSANGCPGGWTIHNIANYPNP